MGALVLKEIPIRTEFDEGKRNLRASLQENRSRELVVEFIRTFEESQRGNA